MQNVQFELSSYTSVDVHISPLPSDLADTQAPPTMITELRPVTPAPTTKTTTPSLQLTLPDSYPETTVPSQHPPLIIFPSPAINM